jgi:hypothetical protein
MKFKSLVLGCAMAASLSFAGSAHAVVNPSFETGDLTGWLTGGGLVEVVMDSASALGDTYESTDGDYHAELTAGEPDVYTTLYQDLVFSVRTVLSLDVAFLGFDYLNFPGDTEHNDDAYVRIYDLSDMSFTEIFTADISTIGDYTATPWGNVGGTFEIGAYRLEAGVRNITDGDELYSSQLLVDNVTTAAAAVPEPGAWALMIVGFGAAGASLRANRRRALA